jgi:hypothetical protein
MKLIFPAGSTQFSDKNGVVYTPDANGMLDIGALIPDPFVQAGFIALPDNAGPSSARPSSGISPGLMYWDTTLNKPVWRNTANAGWVDATGAGA